MVEEAIKELFKKTFGEKVEAVSEIASHGSNRKYFRLKNSKRNAIGCFGPDTKENAAFLGFSRHFKSLSLPVPEIYAHDDAKGIYLQEDLGDVSLFQFLTERRKENGFPPEVVEIYEKTVRKLPQFQIRAAKNLDYRLCYPRAKFDKQSMKWDLNHFKYYFLQLANIPFHEQALEDDFEKFMDFLMEAPCEYFLYRDFQSRNVMIKDGEPYFIDYQGGRKGALQYDIASLLYDAKADVPFKLREELLGSYLKAVSEITDFNRKAFLIHYHAFVYVRIMQAMGIYGLRGFYERKSHFLQSIPYAIRNLEYLQRMVELPVQLPELMNVIRRIIGSSYLRQFGQVHLRLTVNVQSFSYKSGVPLENRGHGGGYVFDCRALPNPGKHERYTQQTGKDREIIEFLDKESAVREFLTHVFALIDQSVENYRSRNFTDLMVAFGCTGGQHRSVYCAEKLARHLQEKYGLDVEVSHRMLEKTEAAAV